MVIKSFITLALSLGLTSSSFAQSIPNTVKPRVEASVPPEIIDKTWALASMTPEGDKAIYVDLGRLTVDQEVNAVSCWVKIFNREDRTITLQKWLYRNGGEEIGLLYTVLYDYETMKQIRSVAVPKHLVAWQPIVPSSFAEHVRDKIREFASN